MSRSRNNALEFSSAGSVILAGNNSTTGRFGAIQCLQDTTFASSAAVVASNVTDPDGTAPDNLNSKTLGAGTVVYGDFTSVNIDSGLVALHKV
tara:strand:- start:1172 stop:1450 length:279 start_codon:yes stop_codon:yes gene_type:complete